MKKLLLSIGLLSGVMLSSTTTNAACVAADCAALGYSTATVEGCTRYIKCPFDTSYQACASTSSETTGTMTCEDAIAAAGGIYLSGDLRYTYLTKTDAGTSILTNSSTGEETILSTSEDVVFYSHDYYGLDKIYLHGAGNVSFRDAREIKECNMSGTAGFSPQLIYINNDSSLKIATSYINPLNNSLEQYSGTIGVLQVARGRSPQIVLQGHYTIHYFYYEPAQYQANPTIYLSYPGSENEVPTLAMNTYCVPYTGSCNINIVTAYSRDSGVVQFHDCVCEGHGARTTLVPHTGSETGWGSGYNQDEFCYYHDAGWQGSGYQSCQPFADYCLGDGSICYRS
ncbi:MAG: hypothetical protein E7018_06610 [Alphaproteobacteria bacterium]|nr:hypothetical protein [Alphaproteobacteria bacterium]